MGNHPETDIVYVQQTYPQGAYWTSDRLSIVQYFNLDLDTKYSKYLPEIVVVASQSQQKVHELSLPASIFDQLEPELDGIPLPCNDWTGADWTDTQSEVNEF